MRCSCSILCRSGYFSGSSISLSYQLPKRRDKNSANVSSLSGAGTLYSHKSKRASSSVRRFSLSPRSALAAAVPRSCVNSAVSCGSTASACSRLRCRREQICSATSYSRTSPKRLMLAFSTPCQCTASCSGSSGLHRVSSERRRLSFTRS